MVYGMISKKLNVLVLSHTGRLLGGAEMSMLDVFDALAKKYDVKPEFILREPVMGLAGAIRRRGWKYHALGYTFWSDGNPPTKPEDIYRNARQNSGAVKSIEQIIKKTKPDIVMTNSIVCPWAAIAARNQYKPHVWFVREYGDLDHGRIFELGREKTMSDVDSMSNLVVTISKSLESHLIKYMPGKKVTVLYNPFKIDDIIKKSKSPAPNPFKRKSSLKLVIAGNLAPSKGQLEAVKAVGRLVKNGHDVELCAVGKEGEPDFNNQMDAVIKENKLENRIHLVGFQDNLLAYVKFADLGIMASRKEGFGRVTFEYLVLGKPVVGANSGATPEMVDDGKNGYLFNNGDVGSLARAIEHYTKDKSLIAKHSDASKRKAAELMSGSNNIDALYKRLAMVKNEKPKSSTKNLHIVKKLQDNLKLATEHTKTHESLKQKVRSKTRAQAKKYYHKARSLKARITGK